MDSGLMCLVKTIGGFIVRLIECCIMNENPEDDECENISDSCTGILTDLLLLVVSIALMINHDMCQDQATHSDVLWALHFNGWVSLHQSVYHLMKLC